MLSTVWGSLRSHYGPRLFGQLHFSGFATNRGTVKPANLENPVQLHSVHLGGSSHRQSSRTRSPRSTDAAKGRCAALATHDACVSRGHAQHSNSLNNWLGMNLLRDPSA